MGECKVEWLFANKEWIFSGAGLTIILGVMAIFKKKNQSLHELPPDQQKSVQQTVSINMNNGMNHNSQHGDSSGPQPQHVPSIEELKKSTTILFIDDDKTFKIVGILKKMGWLNTRLIKDINSLSDHNVVDANILFIDIQGVGKLLQLKDEGLGLALAIKRRYPAKKIIIYSAQADGERFHEALSEADYSLPKTAEPVRFEETIIKVLTQ
jgi:hypothetical protein